MHKYGWLPDVPDLRDHLYRAPFRVTPLPRRVDLRKSMPPVYDQGTLGSCTANAIGAAYQFNVLKQGGMDFLPSRLFIYYEERVLIDLVNEDSGAYIRDGFKVINKKGSCREKLWPYAVKKFRDKPSPVCYTEGLLHQSIEYMRLTQTLGQLRGCLAAGYPFVFGFAVYESFESDAVATTGKVPMPNVKKESMLGGHAVMAVGYDRCKRRFIVRNSWGTDWGEKGYFSMPDAYLTNPDLSDDFWTLRLVEV